MVRVVSVTRSPTQLALIRWGALAQVAHDRIGLVGRRRSAGSLSSPAFKARYAACTKAAAWVVNAPSSPESASIRLERDDNARCRLERPERRRIGSPRSGHKQPKQPRPWLGQSAPQPACSDRAEARNALASTKSGTGCRASLQSTHTECERTFSRLTTVQKRRAAPPEAGALSTGQPNSSRVDLHVRRDRRSTGPASRCARARRRPAR
jgi:hypothetical protein